MTVPTCNFVSTNANSRLRKFETSTVNNIKEQIIIFQAKGSGIFFFSNKLNPNIYMHKWKKNTNNVRELCALQIALMWPTSSQ